MIDDEAHWRSFKCGFGSSEPDDRRRGSLEQRQTFIGLRMVSIEVGGATTRVVGATLDLRRSDQNPQRCDSLLMASIEGRLLRSHLSESEKRSGFFRNWNQRLEDVRRRRRRHRLGFMALTP